MAASRCHTEPKRSFSDFIYPSHLSPALAGVFLIFMIFSNANAALAASTTVGKYRIAVLPAQREANHYCGQVSIASGQGRASTDRIIRFSPVFATSDAAARYALAQGIGWAHEALGIARAP
jgi:hypothetical protein